MTGLLLLMTIALELGAGGGTTTALELGTTGAAEEVTIGMVTGTEEVMVPIVTGTEEVVGSTGQTVVPMVIVSVVTVVESAGQSVTVMGHLVMV